MGVRFQTEFQGKHTGYENMLLRLSIAQVRTFPLHVEAHLHNLLSMAANTNTLVASCFLTKKFHFIGDLIQHI